MAVRETEIGEQLAQIRSEWSVAIPGSLIMVIILLSPLLFDLFQKIG
ncbi:MAG: hypothetical protein ACOX87_13480 [Chloroflexota bacterium]|jgi:hypothetical protein